MQIRNQIVTRLERECDYDAVRAMIASAFKDNPRSQKNEHKIVDALRADLSLTLSYVAEFNGEIVGHVAFSSVKIEGENIGWYGLAPLSVRPDMQRKGVGKILVTNGLSELKKLGASGCVVLGDPNYYQQFCFTSETGLVLNGVPPEYFMAATFKGDAPLGVVTYHTHFNPTTNDNEAEVTRVTPSQKSF
jgi:putative acetyltransferase